MSTSGTRSGAIDPDWSSEALGLLLEMGGHLGNREPSGGLPNPWRERLESLGSDLDLDRAQLALDEAKARYAAQPRALVLCRGSECRRAEAASGGAENSPIPILESGCQGHCEDGPRGTLLFDGGQRAFRRLDPEGLQRVVELIERAVEENTLLVDRDPALPVTFDPVHDHSAPDLSAFGFLVGQFRGEGSYARGQSFRKEVVGRWAAGGSAVTLRMEVSYPLPRGGVDSHQGLVVIGAERDGEDWIGRSWTDGGHAAEHRYRVDPGSGAVVFADRPPGHGHSAKRARKLLIPRTGGYEERLEVEDADGNYATYSSLQLLRREEPWIP